ncbi:permease prefix domain 1-containing protein [Saccharothrix sp. S26]|uniref:permease prefix domain 1-containing protein n=1 Tax=Saccharothrix sp. S26 TaxID=2907215 RepID=UPI001F2C3904|nr:permease prefix domain 1-containing protein [Saccharothrix sp. S26]MCE6998639.1 permease prefix domain 1-containing protein [Saccharothrix sp. S26]
MSAGPHVDPVEDYLATLTASLHGPVRAKAAMMREVRDGLVDAVEAQTCFGVPYAQAAHRAVRDFGPADEIAPSFQRELTIAQTRRTARAAAVTVPVLALCLFLVRAGDPEWRLGALAAHLTVVATAAGLLAVTALVVTGPLTRLLPTPHRLPSAVAWTATAAAVGMAVAAVALGVTSALSADWPLTACAGVLAIAAHGVVAASARDCRECARAGRSPRAR